ncbi:MAG: two-component regulator propeller domain-containing protein [Bacteroidota bacterium]|nr:two-component regulator propeller domain-containing protein [Bacteroidota bacterium]
MGTDDGLVRFDGMEFSTYNTSNTNAFKTNNISSLVEDRDGRLWIGCRDGGLLSYYEDSFKYYFIKDSLKDDRILSMCLDHENNLWIGTPRNLSYISLSVGVKQTSGSNHIFNKFSEIDFSTFDVYSIVCDDFGTIWVTCKASSYVYKISHGKKEKSVLFSGNFWSSQIYCFFSDSKGRNWIGTVHGLKILRNGNLSSYSGQNGQLEFRINTIMEDQIGNLWIGTHGNGLYKLDTAGYIKKFYIKDEISLDRVVSLFEDTEGGIWIGTRGGGLHRLQKKILKTYTTIDGLSDNRVWSICESRNNDIWIGTQKGLNKLTFNKSREVITRLPIPGNEKAIIVRTIIEDHNNVIWIGAGKDILRYSNGKLKRFLSVNEPRSMVVDSNNNLWIGGGDAGLIKVQNESHQIFFNSLENLTFFKKNFSEPIVYQIKALCYDDKGSLWIGTKNGLFRSSGDSLYFFDKAPGLTGNAVMTLLNDSKGTLWITVYGFGLFRFNTGNNEKQFSRITRDAGLIDNTIYSILEDDYGKFWFGSNKGIFSINRQEVVDFCDGKISSVHAVAYGLEAGMESIECNGGNHPSAIKSKDGRLWFPTMGGVTVVDPGNLNWKQDSLKVYIQKTVVDGVELSTNRLHSLEPGNKRKIEFRYTAINFSNSENIRFKYRLEGYDDEWIDAQNQRIIYYLNIPPGQYNFRVLASNHTGAWNTEGASISFVIPQHYWETDTFKILVGILIVGIIIGITRLFFARKLQHQLYILENQRALEQERLRISRDIHDEIGSRLTKISVLNEAVKDEIDKAPLIQEFTEKISNETKLMIENLDEIIWFINPGNDSIEHLGTFLREYIADFFSSFDIECNCEFPDSYPAIQISPEVRRNTVLIVKEITNNVVKHASATKVNAKFYLKEQTIWISLKDNGKGFCTREPHPLGNGLINIQKRIEEIGGKIIIESVVSSGTAIQIFLPLKNT